VIDINLLLSPSDRSRWILINALAINDAGQIAGTARSVTDASLSGFLLTPATQ
jgi:hypothetical protein